MSLLDQVFTAIHSDTYSCGACGLRLPNSQTGFATCANGHCNEVPKQ